METVTMDGLTQAQVEREAARLRRHGYRPTLACDPATLKDERYFVRRNPQGVGDGGWEITWPVPF